MAPAGISVFGPAAKTSTHPTDCITLEIIFVDGKVSVHGCPAPMSAFEPVGVPPGSKLLPIAQSRNNSFVLNPPPDPMTTNSLLGSGPKLKVP